MKDYRQLLKELPSNTLVCALGDFDPPTVAHELLVKTVKIVAEQKGSDYLIFTSPSSLIQEEKKANYLSLMFPKTNFKSLGEKKFNDVIKELHQKYKNIIIVTGSDQSASIKKLIKEQNIKMVSINEKDPDANSSKMKNISVKGLYEEFKKHLPSTIREIDSRRLMNDIRLTAGLEPVKEQIILVKDELREQYFKGNIFNVGDIVESNDSLYRIVKRGSNHLLLKDASGNLVSKWIQDVKITEEKEMNEDLTSKTLKPTDKLKIARVIATMLGVDNAESSSNAENLVNTALRKVRTKTLNPEALSILDKMLNLATEQGIQYDTTLKPNKLKEGTIQPNGTDKIETGVSDSVVVNKKSKFNAAKDILRFNDFKKLKTQQESKQPEESQADTKKDNESDIDADYDTKKIDKKEVGHTFVSPGGQDNLRRRKVKYHLGEEQTPADVQDIIKKIEKKAAMSTYEKEGGHELTAQHIVDDPEHNKKQKKLAQSFLSRMQASMDEEHVDEGIKDIFNKKAVAKQKLTNMIKSGRVKGAVIANKLRSIRAEEVELQEEHLVHVDDGSNYGDKPHDKDVEHVMAGVKKHNGEFDGHSDKGAYFKFKSHSDAKNFADHVKKAPHKSVYADLHEQTEEQAADREQQLKKFNDMVKESQPCSECGEMNCDCHDSVDRTALNPTFDPMFKEEEEAELSDKEIEEIVNSASDEDIMELYEEEELFIIDEETGEELPVAEGEELIDLMEVLSRQERMRAKMRLRRTASKRERSTKIALKRYSSTTTINKRARRLAIKLMKKRMLRGRDPAKISVGEKERIEKTIAKRKAVIGRVAQRLVSRVRKVEKNRMSHGKATKGSMPSVF